MNYDWGDLINKVDEGSKQTNNGVGPVSESGTDKTTKHADVRISRKVLKEEIKENATHSNTKTINYR